MDKIFESIVELIKDEYKAGHRINVRSIAIIIIIATVLIKKFNFHGTVDTLFAASVAIVIVDTYWRVLQICKILLSITKIGYRRRWESLSRTEKQIIEELYQSDWKGKFEMYSRPVELLKEKGLVVVPQQATDGRTIVVYGTEYAEKMYEYNH